MQMMAWGYYPEQVGGKWTPCTDEEKQKAREELRNWALGIEQEEIPI